MSDSQMDKYIQEMQENFIAACVDELKKVEKYLETLHRNAPDNSADIIKALRRIAHNLKGTAGTCGFPAISIISHRLEDYLLNLDVTPGDTHLQDIHNFFDRIDDVIHKGETESVAEMIRTLPVYHALKKPEGKSGSATASAKAKAVLKNKPDTLEAMLIMSGGRLQRRVIEQEMAACGFRVTNVSSSTEAFEMALRIKPDMILSSHVIDDLVTGVELAQIFNLLEATRDTTFILLTSFSRQSKELKNLPEDVKIARKNEHFLDDFSRCLLESQFGRKKKGVKK